MNQPAKFNGLVPLLLRKAHQAKRASHKGTKGELPDDVQVLDFTPAKKKPERLSRGSACLSCRESWIECKHSRLTSETFEDLEEQNNPRAQTVGQPSKVPKSLERLPPGTACHCCREGKVKCTHSRLDSETLKDFEDRPDPEQKTVGSTYVNGTKPPAGYNEWHADETIIVEPFDAARDDDMQHPSKRPKIAEPRKRGRPFKHVLEHARESDRAPRQALGRDYKCLARGGNGRFTHERRSSIPPAIDLTGDNRTQAHDEH